MALSKAARGGNQGDEVEGSPSRDGVNQNGSDRSAESAESKNDSGKIDGSADAFRVRHHPFLFPSSKSSTTRLTGNSTDKPVEHGKISETRE